MRVRLVRSRKDDTDPDVPGRYIRVKLPSDEWSAFLFSKLSEELGELSYEWYVGSVEGILSEAADVMDVIFGLLSMLNMNESHLLDAIRNKREKGDFKTPLLYEEYPEPKT